MQSSAPSSSNNFSAIARRLLLKRQAPESPAALFAEKTPKCEETPVQPLPVPLPVHINIPAKTEHKQVRDKPRIILQFSPDENRYLVYSFLAHYDEYYGRHSSDATRSALRNIKLGFLEKWADDLTVLRGRKRSSLQVFEKMKKNINIANHYIKALKKYQAGEISQLPPLQSYLEPLVAKFLQEEQKLHSQGLSRNFCDEFDEVRPVNTCVQPEEIDGPSASGSVDVDLFMKAEWSGEKEPSRIRTPRLTLKENQLLISWLLENYDQYYDLHKTGVSRVYARFIKDKFHEKWASKLSALSKYKRTAPLIYDRIRKSVTTVKNYIKALDRYESGALLELPHLPTHLEALVPKIRDHISRFPEKSSNARKDLMPTDHSPSPDEIDDLETGSSVDDEHSREAACSEGGSNTKDNKMAPFSSEEDQQLASWLLEHYDKYYGFNCTEPTKLHVRTIKNRFHQKWARQLSALGPHKRTASQVFERVIKIVDMVRNHLEAQEKHWHGEELPSYLEPLVSRVWEHEQLLSKLSGKFPNDYDEMMHMDHSPPQDETDGLVAGSTNDDGHEMVLFAPVSDSKTTSETSVVFFPPTDQETKPPAEQAVHLLPGSDTNTAGEPAIYLPPSDEEAKPPAEQHASALLLDSVDDKEPDDTVTSAFDLIPKEVLGIGPPDDEMVSYGSEECSYVNDYSEQSDFDPFPEEVSDMKPPGDGPCDQLSEEFYDVKPPGETSCFRSEEGSSANGSEKQVSATVIRKPVVTPKSICECLRQISGECLKEINADPSCRPPLGRKTKVMVRRVRQFFEEIKKILGDACEGTIFTSTVELTAWACGVTPDTVTRLGMRPDFVHELLPRAKKRVPNAKRDEQEVVKRHGEKWGAIIRDFIENRLPQDHMTTLSLHSTLRRFYSDFTMSTTTLKYLLHGLGVKFVKNHGKQRMVFET
ncbi:hypothetical protein Aduo_007442 [Ancylostoma duodenale]